MNIRVMRCLWLVVLVACVRPPARATTRAEQPEVVVNQRELRVTFPLQPPGPIKYTLNAHRSV